MSSFRDQLGEDWLRYQHHLDGGAPTTISSPYIPQTLTNGVSTSITPSHPGPAVEVPEVLPPPPLLSPEPNNPETDSTLQWLSPSGQQTDSTLEASTVDGPVGKQEAADSHQSSPDSQRSARVSSGVTNPEEEDEIGGKERNSSRISSTFHWGLSPTSLYFLRVKVFFQQWSVQVPQCWRTAFSFILI